ncbi:hypothetical protein [Flagellimonas zhangzhouensis]|uniref:LTXXQ motif family protein n=1 Tax=Flagellimonas zhangzhouensis TaxID=1073328 RepID=A0A1H2RPR6_9FLAO|nr:hypothetical protein [Allomuricauda zhangzhouensis]SDQ66153.1 hypothetical protein SAMN05216294_2094 [Allomuricauda zhangzhouensis]SDW21150.1 hypothetical protein SAMN04487892_0742 [Allomuricauda zhangzhouensis]
MNKRALLFFTILLAAMTMHAQGPVRDRIKTLKVAFITERLDLTSEEAQQFWPIYNEHEEKLESIRRKERTELHANLSRTENLSESQAQKLLDNVLALKLEQQKAEKDFISKMTQVISAKKMLLLIKSEEDFKRQMLQQYRKRRGN